MNQTQRIMLCIGAVVTALIGLFPPYLARIEVEDNHMIERHAGYAFLFSPPDIMDARRFNRAFGTKLEYLDLTIVNKQRLEYLVNYGLLAVEWIVIMFLAIAAFLVSRWIEVRMKR